MPDRDADRFRRENEILRRRLLEMEEVVHALRAGEADAVYAAGSSESPAADEALRSHREVAERSLDPAAVLAPSGAILHANRRFCELLQRPLSGIVDRRIQEFIVPDHLTTLERILTSGSSAPVRTDVEFFLPDGIHRAVHLGVDPLDVQPGGPAMLIRDLTDHRRLEDLRGAQEALRISEERLELAQQAGHIGTYEWDVRTGRIRWSAMKEDLYGLLPGGFGGRHEDWARAVHPDDLARAEAERRKAIVDRSEYHSEFRIVRPDGEIRWIASKGKVYCDENGEPVRLLGVSQDITEQKRTEEELREAARAKDAFLATLAHELRNPLAPIRNAVQILRRLCAADSELEWVQKVLDRQVTLMGRLLDDLFDTSRVYRGKLQLRRERVNVEEVLEAAMETSRPAIEAERHELVVRRPDAPVYVDGDAMRLSQVFANLLNNAARYTDPGGRIEVTIAAENGEMKFSIRDNGIGIDREMLPRVFDLFSQARPKGFRPPGGLGIGLSLVKVLVELHGGRVEAKSEGPGKGSEFTVHLPLVESGVVPAPEPAAREEAAAPKRRVLVVDDNRDSTESMAKLLEILGNDVRTAFDGLEAIRVAEEWRPEAILLDIGMPRLDGYEACRRIRENPWGRDMIIVALTGWGQEEDRRRTEEAGFDHHLIKPVDPRVLTELMERLPERGKRNGR